MVLAISFLEAPLKFRAPDVTLRIGLGIGRLVFRALNAVEAVLAALIGTALVLASAHGPALIGFAVAATMLAIQLLAVRPRLSRRSDAVLAAPPGCGEPARSRAHYVYVGLELVKVVALVVTGAALLR
ncbi:MAG: hypothetical protein PGN27_02500 [Mycolicibacterium neoaurum]|uniref:hypothetical protein n=1 Tax=Mycolicibacterium neoaurum TaxID=1795 RepID=UPI002FF99832